VTAGYEINAAKTLLSPNAISRMDHLIYP